MTGTSGRQDVLWSNTGGSVWDQIDVALYAVDSEGVCVRLNRAAEQLLGYAQAELLGREMHGAVHAKRADGQPYPVEECPLLQARAAGATVHGIHEVLWNRDGQPIPVECSASPLTLSDGSVGTIVTLKDLRDRVSAEQQLLSVVEEQVEIIRQRDATAQAVSDLATEEAARQRAVHVSLERLAADQIREQRELLETVAKIAPVGIAVFDRDMRIRWTNNSFTQLLDPAYRHHCMPGTSFFDLVPTAHQDDIRAIAAGVQETGKAFMTPAYAMTGVERGTTYWRWSLSRLEHGGLMSTSAEVSEQVQARREVEAVYANAPVALSLVDATTKCYLRVNLQYAELMGVSPVSMLGKPVGAFSSSSDGDHLTCDADGKAVRNRLVTMQILARPEADRHLLVNAVPNCNEAGTVETISIALTDVTAQKRAENALVQADKLAAVGRLAASISHEINNPLEAVTNLLYLVHQDPALSDESCTYIKQAEEELQRVSQIASQTLRFQRHALKAVSVMARQLVDPVVAMYRGRLKHTKIDVTVEYCGNQDQFTTFEGDVRQILNNLIGNAIDALGAEGGKITVRAKPGRCMHTHRKGMRISIADTGHGMSRDTAEHIFEPFFTTKGAGGSGLGLWISHTLAQRHAGSLRVRSRKATEGSTGQSGTVFSLFLPSLAEEKIAA